MSFYLIGLSGKKQSGKNTVARIAKQLLPKHWNITEIAFADSLKDEVAKATGVDIKAIEDNKAAFRTILQWWGTEFRRKFCNEDQYWIKKVIAKLHKLDDNIKLVFITDVRFKNEFDLIKNLGGEVWRIAGGLSNTEDNHPSETSLDLENFDITIHNSGTLDELIDSVRTALIHQKLIINILTNQQHDNQHIHTCESNNTR